MLPEAFIDRMKEMLGDEFEEFLTSFNDEKYQALRVNTLKVDKEDFYKASPFELENVKWCENGFYYNKTDTPGKHCYHEAGVYYIQEPSAMLPGELMEAKQGERILDMCAAPGGKSTHIASYMKGEGILVCNEIHPARAKILSENIERMGIRNAIVTNESPNSLAKIFNEYFDRIMVDAPCSGEGMFRKDPDTICEWSEDRISTNSDRQLEILMQAHKCLKTGGIIIYSTCTFSEIEDEDVVLRFLEKYNYEIMDVVQECKEWTTHGTKIVKARRFYPFTGNGEGQFVCVIKKLDECEEFHKPKRLIPEFIKGKDKEILENFLKDNFDIPNWYKFVIVRDEIMAVTQEMLDLIPLKINIINAGVRIGRIEKGILKPHHQVFSAFGKYAKAKIELSQDEFRKYVHGEELDNRTSCTGYACLTIFGAAVGGVKCSGDKLKNMYPKGLRF